MFQETPFKTRVSDTNLEHQTKKRSEASVIGITESERADVNLKDNEGNTELHTAVMGNHRATALALPAPRAALSIQNKDGLTPHEPASNAELTKPSDELVAISRRKGGNSSQFDYGTASQPNAPVRCSGSKPELKDSFSPSIKPESGSAAVLLPLNARWVARCNSPKTKLKDSFSPSIKQEKVAEQASDVTLLPKSGSAPVLLPDGWKNRLAKIDKTHELTQHVRK